MGIAPTPMDVRQRLIALALQRGDPQGALRLAREAQSRQPELPCRLPARGATCMRWAASGPMPRRLLSQGA